jgi:hypothetical protein
MADMTRKTSSLGSINVPGLNAEEAFGCSRKPAFEADEGRSNRLETYFSFDLARLALA